jgi:hypothetical protein
LHKTAFVQFGVLQQPLFFPEKLSAEKVEKGYGSHIKDKFYTNNP